jgi:hypothetical protein
LISQTQEEREREDEVTAVLFVGAAVALVHAEDGGQEAAGGGRGGAQATALIVAPSPSAIGPFFFLQRPFDPSVLPLQQLPVNCTNNCTRHGN